MLKTFYYHSSPFSYADFGDPAGFPVLLQHGLIASVREEPLFTRLAQAGRRLISVARPGYGESSPYAMQNIGEWGEITACLAEELGLTAFDVLGMSSGAPFSYAIGWRLPERVRTLYILSGMPALYDARVAAHWPYPLDPQASLPAMQKLAHDLFFANLSPADLENDAIRDSMRNDCFGPGLDFQLRCRDWGFTLAEVRCPVIMRHSRSDESFAAAQVTASLLPNCRFDVRENDAHFSQEVLDDFIDTILRPLPVHMTDVSSSGA